MRTKILTLFMLFLSLRTPFGLAHSVTDLPEDSLARGIDEAIRRVDLPIFEQYHEMPQEQKNIFVMPPFTEAQFQEVAMNIPHGQDLIIRLMIWTPVSGMNWDRTLVVPASENMAEGIAVALNADETKHRPDTGLRSFEGVRSTKIRPHSFFRCSSLLSFLN